MKKILFWVNVIVICAAVIGGGVLWWLSLLDYSDGYRMGMVTKFSEKGWVITTGEGQMLLGRDSSPITADYKTSEGDVVPANLNPWSFSTGSKMMGKAGSLVGRKAWLHYNQYFLNISFRDTDYEALDAGELSPPPSRKSMEVEKPLAITKSEGVRAGRIVAASKRGKVVNTWELMLQLGDAGNQFKPLSVSDEGLFNYAVECLKSGQLVTVKYVNEGVLKVNLNETPYVVYAIALVEEGAPK
ncbi:hypothetical protein FDZ71_04815, partial [bacterium]